MRRKTALFLALLTCLLVLSGSAPAYMVSASPAWAAATPLYGEMVCPTLLPGEEDGSLVIRWISFSRRPALLHIGPDDGSGMLPPEHRTELVGSVRSATYELWLHSAELRLDPGKYLYSLTEEGESSPGVLYPIRWRCGESFRVVMSSDSHLTPSHSSDESALYDRAMTAGGGEQGADLIFHGGDMNDNADTLPFYLSSSSAHTRSVPTLTVCGNHDLYYRLYGYFTPPHLDRATGDYWSIQNRILFVGLNVSRRDPAAHARYVQETVDAHREGCDWTVLLVHYSLMSNGEHGWDPQVTTLRDALLPVLARTDVDLVLSGHDHEYDRSFLISGEGMVPGSGGERVEKHPGETLFLSLPTAVGNKLYTRTRETLYPLAAEGLQSERGYVTADFTQDRITVTAWSADTGQEADHFILTRAEETKIHGHGR